MKRNFKLTRLVLSLVFVLSAFVVGVYATLDNRQGGELNGSLRFKSDEVKAGVEIFQGMSGAATNINFESIGGFELDGENQDGQAFDLGDKGWIDFDLQNKVYGVKVEITNKYAAGGRNISVFYDNPTYYLNDYWSTEEGEALKSQAVMAFDDEDNPIIPPQNTLILTFTYTLNVNSAPSFDGEDVLPVNISFNIIRL